jgi:ubiquinol oxidase
MKENDLMELHTRIPPKNFGDRFALFLVKFMRFFADAFFRKRYGHRAVVIETVAAVPGMVGGMLLHLKCLRRLTGDKGWIKELLDEAENERMHLMTFLEIAQPSFFERFLIIAAQVFFFTLYTVLYICSARIAHRLVGYLEEEAIISYTEYLKEVEQGKVSNVKAPALAIDYWHLDKDARLTDLIKVIRDDERKHRDTNHKFSDELSS